MTLQENVELLDVYGRLRSATVKYLFNLYWKCSSYVSARLLKEWHTYRLKYGSRRGEVIRQLTAKGR